MTDGAWRGRGLGACVLEALKALGAHLGAYKIILDCTPANVPFYVRCGFQQRQLQMSWVVGPPAQLGPSSERPDATAGAAALVAPEAKL